MAADKLARREGPVNEVEERTYRRVDITFDESKAYGKYNEQEASPLFSKLPREIRDLVWAYATSPFEDEDGKFEETAYYYRPGHTARLKTEYTILLVCRRAFLEAAALPMLQAEHSFYYHRAAPDARNPGWMATLTEHNRQHFGHLHIFAQMYAIEDLCATAGSLRSFFLQSPPVHTDFQPRMLHVTIRHTDWWFWESEADLRLEDHWVSALLHNPDLRSTHILKLELETLDYKAVQLEPIVERIRSLTSEEIETHIIDGKPAKTKFELLDRRDTYAWEGPANIENSSYGPYKGKDRLKYYVVTLTWKLRFPGHPTVLVPQLRRGPRIKPSSSLEEMDRDENDKSVALSRHRRLHLDQTHRASYLETIYVAKGQAYYGYEVRDIRVRRKKKKKYGISKRGGGSVAGLGKTSHAYRRHVAELNLRNVSQGLAQRMEDEQRRLFLQAYGHMTVKQFEAKWKEQKSLLKFVD